MIDYKSDKQVNPITGEFSHNESSKREQRRYEIARDCLAASMNARPNTPMSGEDIVKTCVKAADLLLAGLEKT